MGRLCRRHLEHHRRHGDPLKGSYRAAQSRPHKAAASEWLKAHSQDVFVLAALGALENLMMAAGPSVEPYNLRRATTEAKARAIWARMRDKGRTPHEVLTSILGVAMCYAADVQRAKAEHRRVQIGKALNRLGGGRVKRWQTHSCGPGSSSELKLRWFPASEGLVLRKLGSQGEQAAEFLIHDRMHILLAYGAQRRHEQALKTLPFQGEVFNEEF